MDHCHSFCVSDLGSRYDLLDRATRCGRSRIIRLHVQPDALPHTSSGDGSFLDETDRFVVTNRRLLLSDLDRCLPRGANPVAEPANDGFVRVDEQLTAARGPQRFTELLTVTGNGRLVDVSAEVIGFWGRIAIEVGSSSPVCRRSGSGHRSRDGHLDPITLERC